jgi:hypothetical protein
MTKNPIDVLRWKIDDIIALSPYPEDVFHSINTLEWIERLSPGAEKDPAMMIAALGHDIERGLEDRRVDPAQFETYDEVKQAHALVSAEALAEIMEDTGIDQNLTDDVARLVANHEVGGDTRQELLKNADVLSFFQVCLPLYFDRRGEDTTRRRCVWAYKKLPEELRPMVLSMDFMDEDLHDLVMDALV